MNFNIDNTPPVNYQIEHQGEPLIVSLEETHKLVKSINTSKSSGIHGISSKVLRDALLETTPQLHDIFNKSLGNGIFPNQWATSMVVPIPKVGKLNEIGNWRPISLLPIPGRLLEKCVHKHILDHLQVNDLLSKAQFGFRPGLGTSDAVFEFSKHVYTELDKGNHVGACYVDASKAFDSVHHLLLLRKCSALGLHNDVNLWLKSYLSDRKQVTLLNNTHSTEAKVSFGVPQGSSLRPLMFLIFVNDLPYVFQKCKSYMYADDLVLMSSSNDHEICERDLNTDVQLAYNWCQNNCITINKKKTKVMKIVRNRYRGPNPVISINIEGEILEQVADYRYLGVTIDEKFTFKRHMSGLHKTTSHKVHTLGHLKKYLSEDQSILLYKQMILPYNDYASFVLDSTTQDLILKLQRIQNRALRVCRYNHMYERSSATALHDHFSMKFLDHRRYTQLLLFMYKQAKQIGTSIPEAARRTRADHKIKFDCPRTTYTSTEKGAWWRGVAAWNALGVDVQRVETISAFKRLVTGLKPPKAT